MYNFIKSVCTLVLCVHHVIASLLVSVFLVPLIQIQIWKQVNHHLFHRDHVQPTRVTKPKPAEMTIVNTLHCPIQTARNSKQGVM